jgi:hypothetical protein
MGARLHGGIEGVRGGRTCERCSCGTRHSGRMAVGAWLGYSAGGTRTGTSVADDVGVTTLYMGFFLGSVGSCNYTCFIWELGMNLADLLVHASRWGATF